MLKTMWTEPGRGSRISALLCGIGRPDLADAFGGPTGRPDVQTELKITGSSLLTGYDVERVVEALRRVGVTVKDQR